MGQHYAGRDLTDALSAAPHGQEVLLKFKRVGRLWEGKMPAQQQAMGAEKYSSFFPTLPS